MGVAQLETFIKKVVDGGTNIVSIKDECEAFERETGIRPTLVFDLMSLFGKISEDKVEELCGGRHQKYREFLEKLFTELTSFADLVFFVDGPTPDEKMDECNRRRNEKYKRSLTIIDAVYDGFPLNEIVETHKWELAWAPTFQNLLEEMAKKFGTLFVAVTKECDSELARYACNNPSTLAIFADDSDYLIFEGKWRYFSFSSMNFEDLTTLEYNKAALRRSLDLTDEQMKTLSTLAGNDIMVKDEAKRFHIASGCPKDAGAKFPFLAELVRTWPQEHEALVAKIAEEFTGNRRDRKQFLVWVNLVKDSFDLYNTNFQLKDYSKSNPILHLCSTKYYDFCYKVLKDMPDNLSLVYYDMRQNDDDYVGVSMELFARQIGVLLQSKRNKPGGFHITTCVKRSHNEKYSKEYIAPIYPEQQVPDLMELLNRQDFPEHDELRFSLLKWMVSDKLLATHDLRAIPKNYLLDVVTLCFMVDKKLLKVVEADLILFTIKKVELGTIPGSIQPPQYIHPRAFKLSFLFLKIAVTIQRCFEIVGFKETLMKIVNFDGVFFHFAFLKHLNGGFNPTASLSDIDSYRLYRSLAEQST